VVVSPFSDNFAKRHVLEAETFGIGFLDLMTSNLLS